MLSWRIIALAALMACWLSGDEISAQLEPGPNVIVVDAQAPAHPFPHFWERMFGSGRAILSLRDSYRSDLRAVKKVKIGRAHV